MGFDVQWDDPAGLAAVSQTIGRGKLRQRQQTQDNADLKFLLGLEQKDKQLAVNAELRATEQQLQQQRYFDAQAATTARQEAAIAASQQELAAQQDDGLARDQLDAQQQQDFFGVQQDALQQRTLDQQANDVLKEFRAANLDPEGKRKFSELSADLRQFQTQRGVTLREAQYQDLVGQWWQDFEQADLGQYEVKEPTIEDQWQQKTRQGDDGTLFGMDRNGMWRKLKDPPPRPITTKEVTANTHVLPNGDVMFVNPHDGSVHFSKTQSEKPPGPLEPPGKISEKEYGKERAAAHERLVARYYADQQAKLLEEIKRQKAEGKEDVTASDLPPIAPPTIGDDDVHAEMDRFAQGRDLYYGRTSAPSAQAPPPTGDALASFMGRGATPDSGAQFETLPDAVGPGQPAAVETLPEVPGQGSLEVTPLDSPPVPISDQREYQTLRRGQRYIAPDGTVRVKQ